MNVYCWEDLERFISGMSSSEKKEPVRIVVEDRPIVLATEISKAHDVYIRPKGDRSCGVPKIELDGMDNYPLGVRNWERTMDKVDIFIQAY